MFENFNADHAWRREWTGRNSRGFRQKLTSESFDNDNKITLKGFFAFCSVFFYKDQRRKDGNHFEKDTLLGFQNSPALHLSAKTYSALSFDQINFFNVANLFSLSQKPFIVCYCFREPIKTFFLDACWGVGWVFSERWRQRGSTGGCCNCICLVRRVGEEMVDSLLGWTKVSEILWLFYNSCRWVVGALVRHCIGYK